MRWIFAVLQNWRCKHRMPGRNSVAYSKGNRWSSSLLFFSHRLNFFHFDLKRVEILMWDMVLFPFRQSGGWWLTFVSIIFLRFSMYEENKGRWGLSLIPMMKSSAYLEYRKCWLLNSLSIACRYMFIRMGDSGLPCGIPFSDFFWLLPSRMSVNPIVFAGLLETSFATKT